MLFLRRIAGHVPRSESVFTGLLDLHVVYGWLLSIFVDFRERRKIFLLPLFPRGTRKSDALRCAALGARFAHPEYIKISNLWASDHKFDTTQQSDLGLRLPAYATCSSLNSSTNKNLKKKQKKP